jgi:SAM-dependent methyltransferase
MRQHFNAYDEFYYANYLPTTPYERNEHWLGFFGTIADHIVRDIKPKTVLDAGCALGFLVESLRNRGVEAYGIDISQYAIKNVHPDIQPYCRVGSITETLPHRYDLIVSFEVLEHLTPDEAQKAIENICQHSDDILFSSTPSDFKEATHINVQPIGHWGEAFARQGFFRDLDYDTSFIAYWSVRYRRKKMSIERLTRQYEGKLYRLWKENWELRTGAIENQNQLSQNHQTLKNLNTQINLKEQQLRETQEKLSLVTESRGWRLLERLRGSWVYSIYESWQNKSP